MVTTILVFRLIITVSHLKKEEIEKTPIMYIF